MKKSISIIMGVLLVLAWYVTLSSWIGTNSRYQGYMEEAERLEKKGLYLDALTQYTLAKEVKPESVETDMAIAEAYFSLGDHKNYRQQLNSMLDSYGPEEVIVEKLLTYYETYTSQNSLISCVKELKEQYPESQMVQTYYDSLRGIYEEKTIHTNGIGKFQGGYAVYELNGKKGLLNTDGKIVLEAVYDELWYNGEDTEKIVVKDDGSYYLINTKGYKTAAPETDYEAMGVLSQGRIAAKKQGKYGYLDGSMKEKIAFAYEEVTAFGDGVAAVKQNDKWALINTKGENVTEFIYDDVAVNTKGSCSVSGVLGVCQGEDWFLINTRGEKVGQEVYEQMKAFEGKGYAPVCKNDRWGYIDSQGTLMVEYQYHDAKAFTNGFAAVQNNGLWGFIDAKNQWVVKPVFSDAGYLTKDGVAYVAQGDIYTLIELVILN